MEHKQSAFITARKGFCYLTVKIGRSNFHLMRIRNYVIEAEEKRDLRRLHPDITFDWKKITRQLAEKREACRRYRSRRITAAAERRREHSYEPGYSIYDPGSRTIYASDAGAGIALLDAEIVADMKQEFIAPKQPPAPQVMTREEWEAYKREMQSAFKSETAQQHWEQLREHGQIPSPENTPASPRTRRKAKPKLELVKK
jgi:hypothetical protein